jgi:hypothetical protein|tara:strand:- start:260 stop:772 length:513 start_codon:yes stop_codon:yes gene_type:complete
MEIKNITTDFIISTVKDHKKHKKILLDLIDEMPFSQSQQNSKSDWLLPVEQERKYLDYFYKKVIDESMDRMQDYFKADQWHIANAWFQQYHDGAHHIFHNHEKTNWANVYFLEMPSTTYRTQVKVRGKLFKYQAKEGQVITFPAHLLHSAPSIDKKRKTVIAFNSNFSHY